MPRASLATLVVALLAAPSFARGGETTIDVGHNRLEPAAVSIAAGDMVVFHNRDEMPGGHTVVSDDGKLSSPALAKDQSWSHVFAESGTYRFHIKQHPGAKATVTVR